MQINNFLEDAAWKFPDNKAVWYKGCWTSYGQIDVLANKLANYLKEIGISRGDRVAILYENSLDYIIAYFAVLKAGAVDVSLHAETTVGTLRHALNHSGAKALIADSKYSHYIIPSLGRAPELRDVITNQEGVFEDEGNIRCNHIYLKEIYDNGKATHPGVQCIDVDLASIVYTSGTTGGPKGVMLSHLNVVSNTRSIVRYLELTQRDRVMVVLPFCYKYGKSLLTTHFYAGGSVVIDNRFVFPQVVLETMRQTEVTGFAGVPSTFLLLLNRSVVLDLRCESLRYITQAGGPMAPSIQKKVATVFAPAKLFVMYGATEASPRLSYLDPADFSLKCGSVGKAISNVELSVVDECGNPLPPNGVGEIVARGSNIMTGYWNDPVETSRVLKNGLYHTGDIGKVDEDGYIYLIGRSDDMIKVSGFRVSPREIEHVLLDLEGVYEAAVIGVNDSVLGQAIAAFVVPEENARLTKDKIREALRSTLPAFKRPTQIELVESIPKNASGKIASAELRMRYELWRKSANN
ncbi:MAG: class I adenylate-forming enzyme family protein [Planctomycetota bacterium]|jgi:acyl-CoA synthetase (AMP-forming)/AMP-acid ligase II